MQLVSASISENTRKDYNKVWRDYAKFSSSVFPSLPLLPSSPGVIFFFTAHLFNLSLSPASVVSKLSAISYINKLKGFPDPCSHFLIQKLVTGGKKLKPQSDSREPLSLGLLHAMISFLPKLLWPIYETLLFRSMLLLSFHSFLRPGEAANSANSLKFENISFIDSCVVIKFKNFKHHFGSPIRIFVKPTLDKFCPVSALKAFLFLRGNSPGNLFCFASGVPISYSKYSKLFHSVLNAMHIKNKLSLHSIRMGAATHAALIGKPEPDIRRAGRWKGESYKKYLRISSITM